MMNPFSNKFLVATTAIGALLFFVAIYVPFFQRVLRTVPLGWWEWLVLFGYAALGVSVYEIGKKFFIARASA
jgi:magnesium-transporting ATPase (P-type)